MIIKNITEFVLFVCCFSLFFNINSQTRVLHWDASGFYTPSPASPTIDYSWSSSATSTTYRPVPWNSNLNGGTVAINNSYVTLLSGLSSSLANNVRNNSLSVNTGWGGGAIGNTDWNNSYFFFSFKVNSVISLDKIDATLRRSSVGPTNVNLQYSVNGSAFLSIASITSVATSGSGTNFSTSLINIQDLALLDVGDVVEFRFYVTGATGAGNFYFMGADALYLTIVGDPLPVELSDFSAECLENGKKLIKWTTASEQNNDYFMLQNSTDAINYFDVEKVNGAGNSNQNIEYSIIDESPKRNVYYRLTQFDYNGDFEVFKPIHLSECEGLESKVTIIGNSNEQINLQINAETTEICILQLLNINGQILHQKEIEINPGIQHINLPSSNLPSGIYLIKVNIDNNPQTIKIVR